MAFCDACVTRPCSSSELHCVHISPEQFQTLITSKSDSFSFDSTSIQHPENINLSNYHFDKDLNIGSLNVCGLKSRLNYQEFVEVIKSYHIFCVQETKIDDFDAIHCDDYNFFL